MDYMKMDEREDGRKALDNFPSPSPFITARSAI
jgi:hypothetical protein